ncbi:ArsA family ATPase [Acidithrix ferrooxidans]|uniref:Arsenical pump-driving ATPase n=1 Tax=Acidithrix ferrooxidans TaxID=1280514 RepID=A0A0D8HMG0_9ACTN|nr:ArsA-related P-loop ATPase [Acidithrix ferrooxidans]KJF18927.1 arsenical pump-driving ATPase [Acidithrix ferrooxidans]
MDANKNAIAINTSKLSSLIREKTVIIMTGPGGVGKTSNSAALAIGSALSGIDTCVVTIDPARRLADALGIETIGNDPVEIGTSSPGRLFAVMLDADATFDELIVKYAKTKEQAGKILSNRVYQNLTKNLSGIQEYMAMEKLFELHNDSRFKLLIVDTPPSYNALDFLDAPRRLMSFLDNRVFRLIMTPGPAILRPLTFATKAVLRTISRVVGSEIVDEAVAFFQDFEGMEDGFRSRAEAVQSLLHEQTTAFVLVTAPRGDTISESMTFGEKLTGFGFSLSGLISNRETPDFSIPGEPIDQNEGLSKDDLAKLQDNLSKMKVLKEFENREIQKISAALDSERIIRIPTLNRDIANLEDLAQMARYLI